MPTDVPVGCHWLMGVASLLCRVRQPLPLPCVQVEQTKEQALSKERAAQSKILDLETQLSRTKTELGQLRRTRDDVSCTSGQGFFGLQVKLSTGVFVRLNVGYYFCQLAKL